MTVQKNQISLRDARRISLYAPGLLEFNSFESGLSGASKVLEQLGYVQIDTISVVERAHHHIFWSRMKDYSPDLLNQLIEKKKSFEYWSHAASYLPIRDYRFSLPRKNLFASGKRIWFPPTSENLKLKQRVMDRIKSEGPLTSRDFLSSPRKKSTGWWDWKPAKKALEQLFMEGKLMVSFRRGFAKVYDLTERVLPFEIDTSVPTPSEYVRYLIRTAVSAHGLVRLSEMAYQRPSMKILIDAECKKLISEGEIESLWIENSEHPYFALTNKWQLSLKKSVPDQLHILSPFDNQVIQRERLKDLFGFDYTIECYLPEKKRKYGYFTLPLLLGDRFIGRIDAKAIRSDKVLKVHNLYAEKGCGPNSDIWKNSQQELLAFARFNGCDQVEKGF